MKTIFAVFVLLGILGVSAFQYGRTGAERPPSFRTLPVARGDLFVGVTATGTVEPVQIIDLGAQIIGSVTSFGPDPERPGKTIDFRSKIKTGDLLAKLDDVPYRCEVNKAKVSLQMAEAELLRSRAREKQTTQALERSKKLGTVTTPQDREKIEMDDAVAKAELALQEAKVEHAKATLAHAESNLAYTVIRSPINGIVIDRRVNVGQTVVAGLNAPSLFLLATDLGKMQVWAAVNEADIGVIHIGQTVTFTVDSFRDRTFTGTVSQVRLNASLQQNVVTYGVIVDVDNSDGKLLPYMTAKIQFEVARRHKVVLVPHQALRWKPNLSQVSAEARTAATAALAKNRKPVGDDAIEEIDPKIDLGTPTVWKLAPDGLARPVAVKVGLTDGLNTEVLGGEIKEGDVVITGVEPKDESDFVSAFVSKVTNQKK